MKNTKQLFLALALTTSLWSFSQVGIGTKTPAPSSILDLTAIDKALLISRVENTNNVTTPVNGMMVYENSSSSFKVFQNGIWQLVVNKFNGSSSVTLNGTNFERAALTGDVTAASNSNATTISDNAVTSAKILDATIANADIANGVGGIYKGSGSLSGVTTVTQGANSLTFSGDGNLIKTGTGDVGIGTATPTADLHVNGTLRFEQPTLQGEGKVLVSDANGNARWENNIGNQRANYVNLAANASLYMNANTSYAIPGIGNYVCQNTGRYQLIFHTFFKVPTGVTSNRSFYVDTLINGVSVKNEETYAYGEVNSYINVHYPVIISANAGDILTIRVYPFNSPLQIDASVGAARNNLDIIYLGI